MNFKYDNNYALAGITKVIYSMTTELFLLMVDGLYLFTKTIYMLGIEYKKSSESSWTDVSIFTNLNGNSIESGTFRYVNGSYEIVEGQLVSQLHGEYVYCRYGWDENNNRYPFTDKLYPIYVIVKNLDPNTSYDFRAYYVDSDGKVYYNQQTITTKPNLNRPITINSISIDSSVYSYYGLSSDSAEGIAKAAEIESNVRTTVELALEIINSMTNTVTYYNTATAIDVIVEHNDLRGGAANRGGYVLYLSEYAGHVDLSTIVHELSHAFMPAGRPAEIYNIDQYNDLDSADKEFYDRIIKYMEFCTHSPWAFWRWLNYHNYPVISSATYNYFFNHFVAAAWEIEYPQTT